MRRLAAFVLLAAPAACVTNPYTGRSQFIAISEAQEAQLGIQGYQEVLGKERISADPRETGPVRRVGERIAAAAARPDFRWEFSVIVDDETVNAWCMPGGKIAFYTGIFPVLQDEAGMAFVMGHEVAHALLRHGAERISQNLAAGVVGELLSAGIGGRDEEKRALVRTCFGAAAGLGILLPFSRAHESEADALGQKLMAQAGYDPRQSVEVWRRMQATAGGGGTPEFLSTHPAHETRIRDLEAGMAGAVELYARSARAPVAALPAVGGRKGLGKGGGGEALRAEAGSVAVRAGAGKRGALGDGRKAVVLEFSFDRDVFLSSARMGGPGGLDVRLEAGSGIAGGERKAITIFRPDGSGPEFPAGRYTATFVGSASGRGFWLGAAFDVP